MRAIFFRRFGYYVSIAALLGLTSLFSGRTTLAGISEVALAASDPVIAAAGDIACDPTNGSFNNGNGSSGSCRQKYTSDLLVNAGLAAVLALGDNQYYCGGYQAYLQSYDLSWGRVKSITRPAVGNHEYLTSGGTDCTSANSGAAGYFNYFGSAAGNPSQGYYSFDVGTWHLIAINSNCSSAGGCSSSSPQGQWLVADLAAHTNFCTLAYWHIPLYSSGGRANANTQSIWQTLYNNNVDVVLNGHDHIYERFAPQSPNGALDTARGIREFIIGSGGANHTSLATIAANSEVRNVDTFGILKLTLHPTSYDWQFVPEAGKTFTDTGTGNCHGTTSGTPLPSPTRTPTATNTLPASPGPSSTLTGTFTLTPLASNITFPVEADARVKQASPTSNYGTLSYVSVDGAPDPMEESYFRFTVGGVSGPIQNAKLRVFVSTNGTNNGPAVYLANNSWTESGITWNTKPALLSGPSDNKGALTTNTWVEYNVSSLISGNGTYTFALIADSTDGAEFSSREGSAAAQLVITSVPTTSTLPPTLTRTLTPTLTITSTSMATSTVGPSPTFTRTSTQTATAILTTTNTSTSTPTIGPSATFTPTSTATFTATVSSPLTNTPTIQPSLTPTIPILTSTPPSPTKTSTPSSTATNTIEPSSTPTGISTPVPTITSPPASSTFVFAPSADSYVNESSPTANSGSATTFRVDGSPIVRTYIRFDVQGLSGTITRVSLRVFANSSSSSGYAVSGVSDNTWTELTINYNNAPAIGNSVGSSGGFSGGVWTTVDITSLAIGNGTINLALTTSSSTAISLASRESGANAPQLIVETVH